MKIIYSDLKKSLLLAFLLLFSLVAAFAQPHIPSSLGVDNCGNCVPNSNWVRPAGTPDVSDRNTAARLGAGGGGNGTSGGGSPWSLAPLPLPPNDDEYWITLRDVGMANPEEIVGTTMTGLVVGREYEITIYSMTTRNSGYSPNYIDYFDFEVADRGRIRVDDVPRDEWGTIKLRFIAEDETEDLYFYPGRNSSSNSSASLFESVNLSVTLDAINTIPEAQDKNTSTPIGVPVNIDVIDGAIDHDGNVIPGSVDLDPSTPGQQTSVITPEGTWAVNNSGVVTFTPAPGFSGEATLEYTVEDDYALDGISAPGISTPKTITVFVENPSLSLVKEASLSALGTPIMVGDEITYILTVTNTGNVTIENIVVNDPLLDGIVENSTGTWPGGIEGVLAPGQFVDLIVTYSVKEEDLIAGMVENTATVSGDDPTNPGDPLPAVPSNSVTVYLPQMDECHGEQTIYRLDAAATIAANASFDGSGGTIDVVFSRVIGTAIAGIGESFTRTLTYTGLGNGRVWEGLATRGGRLVLLPLATDGPGGIYSNLSPNNMDSHIADLGQVDESFYEAIRGDELDELGYFDIVLEGLDDLPLPAGVTITNKSVEVGTIGNGTYSSGNIYNGYWMKLVGQGDVLRAGNGSSTPTVVVPLGASLRYRYSAFDDGTQPIAGHAGDRGWEIGADAIVFCTEVADLSFLKEADLSDTNGNGKADKDEVITYTFTVKNTGTVTLSDVSVSEATFSGTGTKPVIAYASSSAGSTEGTLLPGESATYTGSYTVTQSDIDAGGVWNQAVVEVEVPEGVTPLEPTPSTPDVDNPGKPGDDPYDPNDPDSPDHRTEVPAEQISKLLLEKESELSEDGNTIIYTFTVTNIGTVTIEDIEVTDVMIPEGITLDKTTLEPQDFAIGIVVYAVTNLDRDAGQVENQAEVTGTPPPTAPVLPPTRSVDPKNPTEPDGKTITEVPSVIEAENDRFGPVQFGEETPSVIENDTYNGNTPTIGVNPKEVNLSSTNVPDELEFDPSTGKVTVKEGTPSGEYTFDYTICENGVTPENCKTANVVVIVENPLEPQPDMKTPYDPTKPEDTPKVTDNDKLGGKPVIPGENVVIEDKTPDNHPESPVTINPDGTITVEEGTPSGEYPFSYEICEIDAAGNKVGECKVVEGSVVVENPLEPQPDMKTPYDPTKPEDTPKVTDNDKLGGKPVVPGDNVVIEDKTPDNHQESPITITPDGTITVEEGTPSGEYPFSYEICEIDGSGNKVGECKVVEGSVVVENPLEPQPDMKTPYDPTKPEDTPKVTDNDKLGGKPVIPGENVVIEDKTPDNHPESPVTINPDGTITVEEGTPSGEYPFSYEICEIDAAGNKVGECKVVEGSVVVENPLVPEEDYRTPYDPTKPEDTPKVTDNDKLGGKPVIPGENVVIEDKTPDNHPESPVTINPDGTITVEEGTPSGEYPFSYEICEIDAAGNKVGECKVVEGSVVVENPLEPQPDMKTPYDPTKPEDTPKVTDNDKLGGKPVVPGDNVVIEDKTPDNYQESPITITPDGKINVPEGTPSGEYPFGYEICEIDGSGNKVGECKLVEGSVVVENPLVPEEDYRTPYDPTKPEDTPKVTDNDKLGGKPVVPGDNVVIEDKTPDNHPESPITITPDGKINVPEGTPSGEYPFSYEICEIDAAGNKVGDCKVVEGSVVVENPLEPQPDMKTPYDPTKPEDTPKVTDNDKLGGKPVIPGENVVIEDKTPENHPESPITINPDGTITVEEGTPSGEYPFSYEICEIDGSGNKVGECKVVEGSMVVENPLIPENDLGLPYDPMAPEETPKVTDNDKLSGKPVIPGEHVTITNIPVGDSPVTVNPDGTITVAEGTPRGEYPFSYEICEIGANPANCKVVTGTVEVLIGLIEPEDDRFTSSWSRETGITPSVLDNDRFNRNPINLDEVTLTPGTPSDPGLRMNPDGTITLAPSLRPGTYEYPYTICEVLNPTNCSSAVAIIVIEKEDLFIPNVFTPNGDGTNDTFEIVGIEGYDKINVVIINRWGNEVYRSENYDNTWNGGSLNEGTYYYIITAHKGGNVETLKGWVLIKKR